MMVFIPVPSHTMRRGARADFGRLFSTTMYGSSISDSFGHSQRTTAIRILMAMTRRKLTRVSYRVTHIWR